MNTPRSKVERRHQDAEILARISDLFVGAHGVPTEEDCAILDVATLAANEVLSIDTRLVALQDDLEGVDLEAALTPILRTLGAAGPAERERIASAVAKRWNLRVPVVRQMIEGAVETDSKDDAESDGVPLTEKVIEIVEGLGLVQSTSGRVFVSFGSEAVPVDGRRFRARIADMFREQHGGTVSAATIDTALLPLLGRDMPAVDVPLRIGGDERRVVIDLADGTGRVIEIDASGVRIQEQSPMAFQRAAGMLPLPGPEIPADDAAAQSALRDFWRVLGVNDTKGQTAIYAWIMSSMRKGTTYTVLALLGPEGTAKTTRMRLVRSVFDPRDPSHRTGLPKNLGDIYIGAENCWVYAIDNLSAISETYSNVLCCLSTGAGEEVRELYTTRDQALFKLARPVALTSIADVVTRADLLSRALVVTLDSPKARRTDEDVARDFAAVHPGVLGAFCWCIHRGMGSTEEVTFPSDVRMVGPATFATHAEVVAGFEEGAVSGAYQRARDEALRVIAEEPIVAALRSWMTDPMWGYSPMKDSETEWKGTAESLLDTLTERIEAREGGRPTRRHPRGWPETPRGMSAAVRKYMSALSALGVAITFIGLDGRERDRLIQIRRCEVAGGDRSDRCDRSFAEHLAAAKSDASGPTAGGDTPSPSLDKREGTTDHTDHTDLSPGNEGSKRDRFENPTDHTDHISGARAGRDAEAETDRVTPQPTPLAPPTLRAQAREATIEVMDVSPPGAPPGCRRLQVYLVGEGGEEIVDSRVILPDDDARITSLLDRYGWGGKKNEDGAFVGFDRVVRVSTRVHTYVDGQGLLVVDVAAAA